MGWTFGAPKPFLDADSEAWHLETWAWLMTHLGGIATVRAAPMVLANREFFPPSEAQGHERARALFDTVRALAGMEQWEADLVAQPERPQSRVSEFMTLQSAGHGRPLGTFGPTGGGDSNAVMITYDPALLDDPVAMVATFAHELAHYLLASVPEEPPGGAEMEEFATDLATVYLGFGLFGASVAFRYTQHQDYMAQGYGWSRHGYLSERDWAFALAVLLKLRDEDAKAIKDHLKPSVQADTRKALAWLERKPELIAPLLAIP